MDRPPSKGLFPRGPSLTLDDFSGNDFIVRDFLETLTSSALSSTHKASFHATPAASPSTATTSVPTTTTSTTTDPTAGGLAPSASVAATAAAAPTAFDPKPLIRIFENTVSQLGELSESLKDRESDLMTQVRKAEIQHNQTLDALGQKLDQSIASFEALDTSSNTPTPSSKTHHHHKQLLDTGGNRAVQIGTQLENLDKKRRRAQDATFLIQCWVELSETGRLTSLQDIQRQGGPDNKIRCALIARRLLRISQRLDPASWETKRAANGPDDGHNDALSPGNSTALGRLSTHSNSQLNSANHNNIQYNTREILEKFCETLEQQLLDQFNNSYRRQNFDDMMDCARALQDFHEGASVIAAFVNQHQFFIDRDQLVQDEVTADGETWERIADPDSEPPGVEPSLQSLIDEVRIVMQEESFIIKRAFPFYETVLNTFIQRVFQQSIQQRLELVLDKASTISSLAFLRTLHSSRSHLNSLVEDLKAHGLTEHPDNCSALTAQTLDQQVEELFIPYLVGNPYIEREKKNLEELFTSLLFKYTIYHSRRQKRPTGFMASLAQQGTQLLASAKDAYMERLESSELTETQKAMMLRVAGLQDTKNAEDGDIEVTPEDGVLSVATARRMIQWMAESVRRALELGSAAEVAKDVNVLLQLLLTSMGQVYIDSSLDEALMTATSQESIRTEPDLHFLPSLHAAITITRLMDRFITTLLLRLAEGNATVRRAMEHQRRQALDALERKTDQVVRSAVAVTTNWLTKLLAQQKKSDFRPREGQEDQFSALMQQTATCEVVCKFLHRCDALLDQALDGPNRIHVASEIAASFLRLLLEHLKRFSVNATGGLVVTQDIAQYVSALKAWPLSAEVRSAVDVLTEVGSLFIVGPEALREKLRILTTAASGGSGIAASARLAKADVRAFVQRRDDASSPGIQSVLAGL